MLEFFALLTGLGYAFWIIFFAMVVTLTFCTEKEHDIFAAMTLVGGMLLIHFFSKANLLEFVKANGWNMALYAAFYVTAGILWSFFKWSTFLSDVKNEYEEVKVEWLHKRAVDNPEKGIIPKGMKNEWKSFCEQYRSRIFRKKGTDDQFGKPPLARNNKSRFVRWTSYWPMSFFWFLVKDMILQIWDSIYKMLANQYQGLSNRKFKSIEADFTTEGDS